MHLPDIIYKHKPTICFLIGWAAGFVGESSPPLIAAQVLLFIAAAVIIHLRQQ